MKKIILILFATLITGCGYDKYKMPEDAYIETLKEVSVYSDKYVNDLIINHNVKITGKNSLIDTKTIGKKETTIDYIYNKKSYKYKLSYEVIDDIAPKFISVSSQRTVIKNTDIDFCESVVFGDNYDKEPTCKIDGEYDLSKPGTYKVAYNLEDASKNRTEKNLQINVVEKINPSPNPPSSSKNYLYFEDVIAKYKNDSTEVGIDVSRWQEEINWQEVKDAGVEFVIMRIGVQSDYDKEISMDSYFEQNIKVAKEVGLKVGVYVYTTATNDKTARDHAKWVINALKGTNLDFPIAFDWENWRQFKKYKINLTELSLAFESFNDELNKHGYSAMLYSSKFYLENIWNNKNNRPVWLAHYTSQTNYQGEYILWQLSNTGRVAGIKGDVDINIHYKKE